LSFLHNLPNAVRQSLVLAEVSRRKVNPLSQFDWGSIVVSFTKPVEHFCKKILNRSGKETLGEVIGIVEHGEAKEAWQSVSEQLKALNQMYIRGKHLTPPPIERSELATARRLAVEILEHADRVRSGNARSE
jgi:hypothetical protein